MEFCSEHRMGKKDCAFLIMSQRDENCGVSAPVNVTGTVVVPSRSLLLFFVFFDILRIFVLFLLKKKNLVLEI